MVVSRFTVKLATDMEKIDSKSYTVLGKNVTFSFDLLPGDMKFLAYRRIFRDVNVYICPQRLPGLCGKKQSLSSLSVLLERQH